MGAVAENSGVGHLSVSNSWSGRHWDGDQLVAYLARQAQTPRGRAPAIARWGASIPACEQSRLAVSAVD